ncbi:hypothetical protein [Microterricola viridarii]|uniref:NTP pyrophosphohydrolase n=1 Tax=Microterricola viridarii TaxID=412690 RepID=A0A0X8E1H7_9MICO|nr:hypothetical protein [Microterricola viridarii]AMB58621.1 hypothetical protein AWU67_06835 [Microterricola viridarii]
MDAAGEGRAGGLHRLADTGPTHPGRIVIAGRVLVKVAEEATADALRVDRGDVSAGVSESGGGIAVSISTRLPVPDLDDTAALQAATPVLERVEAAQAFLRDQIGRLIGRDIIRINMTITGAVVEGRRRVR